MNYILGSGLIAFLLKRMYPKYNIIPVGKSRFYQYDYATCDNYIIYDDRIDDFIKSIVPSTIGIYFKRALSINGQILFNLNGPFFDGWINKLYGDSCPQFLSNWNKDGFAYNTSGTELFKILEQESIQTCKNFIIKQEKIVSIDTNNKLIHTNEKIIEYDNIISTVPRNYLFNIIGIEHDLKSKDLHTFIIETNDLDFEGASELLVADNDILFHKCTKLSDNIYQFYSTVDIDNLPRYLSKFIRDYNIMSGTCVINALCIGDPHNDLIPDSIKCIGSSAEWNDLVDLKTSILHMISLGGN